VEKMFFGATGLMDISPPKKLAQESNEQSSRPSACMKQRLHFLTAAKFPEDVLFWHPSVQPTEHGWQCTTATAPVGCQLHQCCEHEVQSEATKAVSFAVAMMTRGKQF